jgi:hypothetical protein
MSGIPFEAVSVAAFLILIVLILLVGVLGRIWGRKPAASFNRRCEHLFPPESLRCLMEFRTVPYGSASLRQGKIEFLSRGKLLTQCFPQELLLFF